jgi:electron transfer flavoprotein beta subunit
MPASHSARVNGLPTPWAIPNNWTPHLCVQATERLNISVKTVVCVKQAIDVPEFVEFDAAGTDVDVAFMEPDLNEADGYAVEHALRLREESGDGEVVVVTAGGDTADQVLRKCLAMGADRAIRVSCESLTLHDPVAVARALAVAVRGEAPELVLCGVQSSDAAQQSTGPALASALDLPCVSVAVGIATAAGGGVLTLHREFEGSLVEVVEVEQPVVVTVQTGLDTPRYPTFKATMKAKKAPIDVLDPGAAAQPASHVRRMFVPSGSGHDVEMLDGRPVDIAQRIIQIVKEAS